MTAPGSRPMARRPGHRDPGDRPPALGSPPPPGLRRRLIQVAFRHDFYNAADYHCPDLVATPTSTSAGLLEGLGMIFHHEPAGFSVLSDDRSEAALLNRLYRATGGWPIDERARAARLTFLLHARHPNFTNFTDVPMGFKSSERVYYLTNRRCLDIGDGRLRLQLRRPVRRVASSARRPVAAGAASVSVLGPGRDEVACVPVCVPRALAGAVATCDAISAHRERFPDGDDDCHAEVSLDFSRLPEGRYRIAERDRAGRFGRRERVVHAPTAPLALLDVFFTPAKGGDLTGFPVGDPCCDAAVRPVAYELWFGARHTRWRYYVADPASGSPPTDLRIDGPIRFAGPKAAQLATGATAQLFVADELLPLEQRSALKLRLLGRRPGMVSEQVVVGRLPAANADRVAPADGGDAVFSDVYVHL